MEGNKSRLGPVIDASFVQVGGLCIRDGMMRWLSLGENCEMRMARC